MFSKRTYYLTKGYGINYSQKKVKDLIFDGKRNATSKNPEALAFYKKGTLYDALEIIVNSNNDIWPRTYSGYVNIVHKNYINAIKK